MLLQLALALLELLLLLLLLLGDPVALLALQVRDEPALVLLVCALAAGCPG